MRDKLKNMFFKAPGKPTKLKKAVYLVAFIILGFLLSFIAHALIEISYLNWALNQGQVVPFYGGCALPPVLRVALLALGAIGGFFLGRFCWRKVYLERFWEKKWATRQSRQRLARNSAAAKLWSKIIKYMEKLREYWVIILLIFCLLAGSFYWFQWRPAEIRADCANKMHKASPIDTIQGSFEEMLSLCLLKGGLDK